MEDDGKYSCTVGNSGGLDQTDAYLHVARKRQRSFIPRLHDKAGSTSWLDICLMIA